MTQTARSRRLLAGGVAVAFAAAVGFADTASAEPGPPPWPNPAPPTITAPAPLTPGAAGNSAAAASLPIAPAPGSVAPVAAGPAADSAAPVQPTPIPATSGTLRDYLQSKGVQLEPQRPQDFNALDITLPVPRGWTQVPDPNVPDPFVVIANRSGGSLYTSNAQLVVYRLVGDFDPKEAISHGFVDSRQLPAWKTTAGSLADFCGFPSSIIEGTYRQNNMTLNTSRRHVIATSGPDRYLVSLAVTTAVTQAVAEAPATDAIVNGFRVAAPAPAPGPDH